MNVRIKRLLAPIRRWIRRNLLAVGLMVPVLVLLIVTLWATVDPTYGADQIRGAAAKLLKDFWPPFGAALVAAWIIHILQRGLERARFLRDIGNSITAVMALPCAWVVPEQNTETVPPCFPVDFRYAVGKGLWQGDPADLECDRTKEHRVTKLHLARHVPLAEVAALGIDYAGLIYEVSDRCSRAGEPKLYVGSRAMHELAAHIWSVLKALDAGLISERDVMFLWRPLNRVMPGFDRFASGRLCSKDEYFKKVPVVARWTEFMLFGNDYEHRPSHPCYDLYARLGVAMAREQAKQQGRC